MREPHRTGILALSVMLALAGCGESESRDDDPGAFRVVKAVVASLLSNSVEAAPTEAAPAPPEPEPVAPPPQPLASFEAEVPQTCTIPYNGPVTIIPVRTAAALARSVSSRPERELVYETDDTAIFEDGRVLTLDMENLGAHLNAVGWSTNPMKILGAGVRPGGLARNLGWNSAENTRNTGKKGKRQRRRRG